MQESAATVQTELVEAPSPLIALKVVAVWSPDGTSWAGDAAVLRPCFDWVCCLLLSCVVHCLD